MGAHQAIKDAATAAEDAFNALNAATTEYDAKYNEAVALIPDEQAALDAAQAVWNTAFASASATVGLSAYESAMVTAQANYDAAVEALQAEAANYIPS